MPTYMNVLGFPLKSVGWQGSQVNAHAKALVGTVKHCQFEFLQRYREDLLSLLMIFCG